MLVSSFFGDRSLSNRDAVHRVRIFLAGKCIPSNFRDFLIKAFVML